jgi:chromate transporter
VVTGFLQKFGNVLRTLVVHIAYLTGANGLFGLKIDIVALALAAMAALALLRYKVGVVKVIAACALAGLVLRQVGCC